MRFALPRSRVDRETFLLQLCEGRRVLHLGCADAPFTEEQIASGRWLHAKLARVARECVGIDFDAKAVKWLRDGYGITTIVQGDVEHLGAIDDERLEGAPFDVVVAGEIIEHLDNPGLFLRGVRPLLGPDGKLAITTANAFCLRRLLRIPLGVESVHQDHAYYFSHPTLETLVGRFGYELIAAHSYSLWDRRSLLPSLVDRLSAALSPNLGEGLVHVYAATAR